MESEDLVLELLIAAIIIVESGGNDQAIGTDGLSFGPMQITDICREDVNRIAGTHYTREDCFNRAKSIEMFKIYVGHYATRSRLDRTPKQEDMARIWNKGPNGYQEVASIKYWKKVQLELIKKSS